MTSEEGKAGEGPKRNNLFCIASLVEERSCIYNVRAHAKQAKAARTPKRKKEEEEEDNELQMVSNTRPNARPKTILEGMPRAKRYMLNKHVKHIWFFINFTLF